MNAKIAIWFLAAFVLASGLAVAQQPLLAQEPLDDQPIYSSLKAVLSAPQFSPDQTMLFTPLGYTNGVALYQVEIVDTGVVEHVFVRTPSDPTIHPEPIERAEALPAAPPLEELSQAPLSLIDGGSSDRPSLSERLSLTGSGTCRCLVYCYKNINYGTLLVYFNVDVNNFSDWSGLNDQFSSLKTTCNGAWFYEHKAWGGSVLYVAPNTNVPNLSTYNFNDKISSTLHNMS